MLELRLGEESLSSFRKDALSIKKYRELNVAIHVKVLNQFHALFDARLRLQPIGSKWV